MPTPSAAAPSVPQPSQDLPTRTRMARGVWLGKPWREVALESAMIVLSLLLALAANRWAEARHTHAVTAQARAAFRVELRANAERVRRVLSYHEALAEAAVRADTLGTVRSYADWRRAAPMWSGFAPPDLPATAWQSALATGALNDLTYTEIADLSTAYTEQARLDALTLAFLPGFDFSDPAMAATVRRLRAYMQTVVSYERALLRDYGAAERAVGGGSNGA